MSQTPAGCSAATSPLTPIGESRDGGVSSHRGSSNRRLVGSSFGDRTARHDSQRPMAQAARDAEKRHRRAAGCVAARAPRELRVPSHSSETARANGESTPAWAYLPPQAAFRGRSPLHRRVHAGAVPRRRGACARRRARQARRGPRLARVDARAGPFGEARPPPPRLGAALQTPLHRSARRQRQMGSPPSSRAGLAIAPVGRAGTQARR